MMSFRAVARLPGERLRAMENLSSLKLTKLLNITYCKVGEFFLVLYIETVTLYEIVRASSSLAANMLMVCAFDSLL